MTDKSNNNTRTMKQKVTAIVSLKVGVVLAAITAVTFLAVVNKCPEIGKEKMHPATIAIITELGIYQPSGAIAEASPWPNIV